MFRRGCVMRMTWWMSDQCLFQTESLPLCLWPVLAWSLLLLGQTRWRNLRPWNLPTLSNSISLPKKRYYSSLKKCSYSIFRLTAALLLNCRHLFHMPYDTLGSQCVFRCCQLVDLGWIQSVLWRSEDLSPTHSPLNYLEKVQIKVLAEQAS